MGKGEKMRKKILQSDRWPKPKGPYSVALSFNHLLFISGQGPAYPDTGEIVKGDFEEQARVVFENLRMILEDAGSSLEHVLKATVFLSDMNNFSRMNEIYGQYFKKDPPVRTTVQVARLPFDIMVEIDVIAYLPK
jgi:2-iminobutanoate/2-iminopropanoate deaminase